MANRTFKIVGRYSTTLAPWIRNSKAGSMYKKAIYISEEKFYKHAPETAMRWRKIGVKVVSYELRGGKWVALQNNIGGDAIRGD